MRPVEVNRSTDSVLARAQQPPTSGSWQRLLLTAALLALAIAATRIPGAITARSGILLNEDELLMTYTILDRFLGVPPAFLSWPGGTMQLISLPFVAAQLVCKMGIHPSPANFVAGLAGMYRNPWGVVFLLRCLSLAVCSVGFSSLLFPLQRLGVGRLASVLAIVSISSSPLLWTYSHMGVPDAISIGLGCLSLAALSPQRCSSINWAIAGILFGLGLAAKLTVLPLVFLIVMLGAENSAKGVLWKWVLAFGACVGIGFIFGVPYAWTDPVRFAKSVLGNLGREGVPGTMIGSITRMARVTSPYLALIGIFGFYVGARKRRWLTVAGALATIALTCWITSRSGVVYDRYYLVAAVPIAMLGALGFELLVGSISRLPLRGAAKTSAAVTIGLAALICWPGLTGHSDTLREATALHRELQRLVAKLQSTGSGCTIIIPRDGAMLFERLADRLSSKGAESLAAKIPRDLEPIARFASVAGLPTNVGYALAATLNNQEQIFAAHLHLLAYPGDREGLGIVIYEKDELQRSRFGLLDPGQAPALFDSEPCCALVLPSGTSGPAAVTAERFGGYDLYVKGG